MLKNCIFGRQLVQNQTSLTCKMSQFLGDLLGKQSPFTLISEELPLKFSARSRPFWQEADAHKKYCFRFQPSSVKCHIFKVISLRKLSLFTFIKTELPFIFFARSGPFWQEAEALKKYCSRFQSSDLGYGHFSRVGTLFPEKFFYHFDTISRYHNYL